MEQRIIMKRIDQILSHPVFQEQFALLQEAEKDRIFCRHTMEHFLDVARLMYIYNLEDQAGFSKEMIYAAGLLHDIGRYEQMEKGTPHHLAGARLAERILTDCDFSLTEQKIDSCCDPKPPGKRYCGNSLIFPLSLPCGQTVTKLFVLSCKKCMQLAGGEDESDDLLLILNLCKLQEEKTCMRIGNREFDTKNETYIMGILNVTPDSFSDGGKFNHMDAALAHAEQMIRDGADIIDIGGESTRPGHTVISAEEEIARVTPVIEAVKSHFDVPVSIDTYKGNVAEAALQAGADLVNDIWGFKFDYKTAEVTARYHAACCLMHNRNEAIYQNFLEDMVADMKECIAIAHKAGVPDDKIMLDPGVGFGKTYEQNLEAINHVDVLQELGLPILLGTSRKSVIGNTLDLPVDQRVEGTLATTVIGMLRGCSFVRVHDIKENHRIIQMTKAILSC